MKSALQLYYFLFLEKQIKDDFYELQLLLLKLKTKQDYQLETNL